MANLTPQYQALMSGPTGMLLEPNTYLGAALAYALAEKLPDGAQVPFSEGSGQSYINIDHVPHIAELLQEVVAYTVAYLINAGSERDVVMENDALREALEAELKGWSNLTDIPSPQ